MVEPITLLLQVIGRHPGASREKLLALQGVAPADLAYLEQHDLIREMREPGCYQLSHLGQMALKRMR